MVFRLFGWTTCSARKNARRPKTIATNGARFRIVAIKRVNAGAEGVQQPPAVGCYVV